MTNALNQTSSQSVNLKELTIAQRFAEGEKTKLEKLQNLILSSGNAAALFNTCLAQLSAKSTPELEYFIAWCYCHGYGVEKDKQQAINFATLSAKRGFADAYIILGDCENDIEIARKHYKEAANSGSKLGIYNLLLHDLQFPNSFFPDNWSRCQTAHRLMDLGEQGWTYAAVVAASVFNLNELYEKSIYCLRLATCYDHSQHTYEEKITGSKKFLYNQKPLISFIGRYHLAILENDYYNNADKLSTLIKSDHALLIRAARSDKRLTEKSVTQIIQLLIDKNQLKINDFFNLCLTQNWSLGLAKLAKYNFDGFVDLLYRANLSVEKTEKILLKLTEQTHEIDQNTLTQITTHIQRFHIYIAITFLQTTYQELKRTQDPMSIELLLGYIILGIQHLNKIPENASYSAHRKSRKDITQLVSAFLNLIPQDITAKQAITENVQAITQAITDDTEKSVYLRFFSPYMAANSQTVNPKPHAPNARPDVRI